MSAFMQATYHHLYLPPELIAVIYSFIGVEYYDNIIYKHVSNYILTKRSIRTVISYCLRPNFIVLGLFYEFVQSLKYLVNAHIPRKYDLHLWANILQILSKKFSRERFYQRSVNIGKKTQLGKSLRQVLDLWLELCKKFNLKIYLHTNKFSKYIRAQNILKMNNYDQYTIRPMIIQPFTIVEWIDAFDAHEFLQNYRI